MGEVLFFGEEGKKLFLEEVVFEVLGSGFSFSEGPVYIKSEDCLYFTDFPMDRIYRFDEEGGIALYTDASNRAIGLAVDARNRIISCESGLHRVAVVDDRGSYGLADQFQGKRLNSPNDVVVAKNGDIYFTDPCGSAMGVPSAQGFCGVYRILESGEVELMNKELGRPNGLAFNGDESILFVNDTDENMVYTLNKDKCGKYSGLQEFSKLDDAYGEGACDGMKVDRYDHIWVTGPGGIWVLNKGGTCIAIVKCPEYVGNFCFGGSAGDELYIMASTSAYRLKLAGRVVD